MDALKFLKRTNVYFEGNYFHFYLFVRTIDEWPLTLIILPRLSYPAILPETTYEVVPTE